MLGGELFCIRVVMICLYYDPDYKTRMTELGVRWRSVHRRDMQDIAAIKQTALCHSLLQRAAVVVSTPLPSSWGHCKAHTPAMCDDPMAVAFAGANALYYLNEIGKQHTVHRFLLPGAVKTSENMHSG